MTKNLLYINNTFAKAIKKQLDHERRAQFSMLIEARNLDLPIDIQTKLFESIVCRKLLYGSQVWGLKKQTCWKSYIEKLLLQASFDKQLIAYWLRDWNKDIHTFAYIIGGSRTLACRIYFWHTGVIQNITRKHITT